MVTLLLTFFIMLFAFSTLDAERFQAIMRFLSRVAWNSGCRHDRLAGSGGQRSAILRWDNSLSQIPLNVTRHEHVLLAISSFQEAYNLQGAFAVEATERRGDPFHRSRPFRHGKG